ncbi:hypothetical protein [Hymenobacter norwichensis]|uniref:hypothetical protein n=1 Tax=Hymenobacter norwichensis TaxID=223903 RepID=UPI0003B3A8CD|nr:hypothetical protein [Hymenobacter norwichensis]
MKSYLSPALLLLLASCQPDTPASNPAASAAPASASTTAAQASPTDTLHVADSLGRQVGVLRLRPSTAAEFAKLPAGPLPTRPTDQENQSTVSDAPLPTDGRVQRQGEQLVLRPAQGPAVTLTPVPSPDGPEGNDNAYYYWGTLPQAHQWVVDVATDEGSGVLLVDQRTGRRTNLLGAPSISPDGRYLLSICEDVISGGTPTNLSVYNCGSGAPKLLWSRDLTAWGPRAARWRDARHVVLQRAHADVDPNADVARAAEQVKVTYVELELTEQP